MKNKERNEKVEKGFPKDPDNITGKELKEHFDLNKDGNVTIEEYSDHINFHCKNPDVLEEELEQADYERGFKYEKGGKLDEAQELLEEQAKGFGFDYEGWSDEKILEWYDRHDYYDNLNLGYGIHYDSKGDIDVILQEGDIPYEKRDIDVRKKPSGIKFDDSRMMKQLWNERGYDIPYLESLSKAELKGVYDTEFYEEKEYNKPFYDDDYAKGGDLEKTGMGGYDEAIMESSEDKLANTIIDNTKVAQPFRAIGEGGSDMIIGESVGEDRKKKQVLAAAIFAPHKLFAMRKARAEENAYATGGALSKEFKFDKNFVVYVPSTSNVGEKISKKELEKRVDEVEKYVANEFGGYTETDTDGGYKSTSGEIIEEDIVKVSVFANNKDWKENESKVVSKVKEWAKEWGQEAIGFEYEGDLYYIDDEGKFAKGGEIDMKEEKIKELEELKEFLKTATDKEDIEQAKLSIEELENEIMYNYAKGGKVKKLYDTKEKKAKAVRKKGNIITFKEMFYPRGTANQGYTQIMVTGFQKQSGSVKIEGRAYDSKWYNSMDDLIKDVDWKKMEEWHSYAKGGKTKEAKTWKQKYNKKYGNDLEEPNSLSEIAENTGVSKKGIQQIYNKGIGAYKNNPSSVRPNVKSKEQWAQARVYSSVMGGKAAKIDAKELKMAKGGLTPDKAKQMLKDGTAQGKSLTDNQKRYFKAVSLNKTYKSGGYTKKGERFVKIAKNTKNKKELNGLFIYNPYYERWGWINDENLADGKLPYRVKISYSKNKPLGEGRLENINDLIIVDERSYGKGGETTEMTHPIPYLRGGDKNLAKKYFPNLTGAAATIIEERTGIQAKGRGIDSDSGMAFEKGGKTEYTWSDNEMKELLEDIGYDIDDDNLGETALNEGFYWDLEKNVWKNKNNQNYAKGGYIKIGLDRDKASRFLRRSDYYGKYHEEEDELGGESGKFIFDKKSDGNDALYELQMEDINIIDTNLDEYATGGEVSLYFNQGASDKEYHIQIEEENGEYVVNFQYGRRGRALKSGTKTATPVSLPEAEKIYGKLLNSKLSKGYTPQVNTQQNFSQNIPTQKTIHKLPQLLNMVFTTREFINDDSYLSQEKMDGERRMVISEAGEVTGLNKKGQKVPLPSNIIDSINNECIIDGEIIGDTLYAFDILSLDGQDLEGEPCIERISTLNTLRFGEGVRVVETAYTTEEKQEMFDKLEREHREGIVFKKKDSPYTHGRPSSGGNQLKFKFYKTATFIVANHTPGKRSVGLELIDDNGEKVFMGKVTIPPNKDIPNVGDLVEVRYLYAYKGGAVYQPTYIWKREDSDLTDATISQIIYKAEDYAKGGEIKYLENELIKTQKSIQEMINKGENPNSESLNKLRKRHIAVEKLIHKKSVS